MLILGAICQVFIDGTPEFSNSASWGRWWCWWRGRGGVPYIRVSLVNGLFRPFVSSSVNWDSSGGSDQWDGPRGVVVRGVGGVSQLDPVRLAGNGFFATPLCFVVRGSRWPRRCSCCGQGKDCGRGVTRATCCLVRVVSLLADEARLGVLHEGYFFRRDPSSEGVLFG